MAAKIIAVISLIISAITISQRTKTDHIVIIVINVNIWLNFSFLELVVQIILW